MLLEYQKIKGDKNKNNHPILIILIIIIIIIIVYYYYCYLLLLLYYGVDGVKPFNINHPKHACLDPLTITYVTSHSAKLKYLPVLI